MYFSIIIPVFNRPDEVDEILSSLASTEYDAPFEVVIIEDGSSVPCAEVVQKYQSLIDISYYAKSNSGPGDSRNYGMRKAKGDYFIIFDSDCIIPPQYLNEVATSLQRDFVHCFGGPDKSAESFTDIQKAVDFAMTSFLTTGGIRGGSEAVNKFQPRSFNMGISRVAFEATGGFGNIHPGEDPDLSIRLWKHGFETKLYSTAYVFHKRRISWLKFYQQVNKFGKARPILNSWYPEYAKITYYFPSLFILGFVVALILILAKSCLLLVLYLAYFAAAFAMASAKYKNLKIGINAVAAVAIQFYGYGTGFIKALVLVRLSKRDPQSVFPELFYKSI